MLRYPLCHPQTTANRWLLPVADAVALTHSPDTGDGDRADGPGVLPHDVVLGEVVTGTEVVGGPLAGRARGAGELVGQVLVRFAGGADPAAVLTWAQPQRNQSHYKRGVEARKLAPRSKGTDNTCKNHARDHAIKIKLLQYST